MWTFCNSSKNNKAVYTSLQVITTVNNALKDHLLIQMQEVFRMAQRYTDYIKNSVNSSSLKIGCYNFISKNDYMF